jgi:hypothetical protein
LRVASSNDSVDEAMISVTLATDMVLSPVQLLNIEPVSDLRFTGGFFHPAGDNPSSIRPLQSIWLLRNGWPT